MNAILGRICEVKRNRLAGKKGEAGQAYLISFKPVCVMPSRRKPPKWLDGQTLKISRRVTDPREIGGIGDSIVLTPSESTRWLFPLSVTPAIVQGRLPSHLQVRLRWWKDDKPGPVTVCGNGRQRTVRLRKAGRQFSAKVATADLLQGHYSLPFRLTVAFDKLTAGTTILPESPPFACEIHRSGSVQQRLESDWYALDVYSGEYGGGITRLREQGRDLEHFPISDEWVGGIFDHGGHVDVAEVGWGNRLRDVEMTARSTRRDGPATRLSLEGVLSAEEKLHTTASLHVFDDLPLILTQREVLRHKGKEKKDDKNGKGPRVRADDVTRVALGFSSHFLLRAEDRVAGRVLSVDDGRFAVVRCARARDALRNGWRLTDGWLVVEHPVRDACMLYLFDTENAPVLGMYLGDRVLGVKPRWLPVPVAPESGAGFTVGISGGEICGAGVEGAWVACRRPVMGGVACALLGRWKRSRANAKVAFKLGGQEVEATLRELLLPGIGSIGVASAVIAGGHMNRPFTAAAGGIQVRRPK